MGVGKSIPSMSRPSSVVYQVVFSGLCGGGGARAAQMVLQEAVVVLVLYIDHGLFVFHRCLERDVRPTPKWLVPGDIQPECCHPIDDPPRASLGPLFECFLDPWENSIQSSFDFAFL